MRTAKLLTSPMCLLGLLILLAAPANATDIEVIYGDSSGEGFYDPTPVAPVGGNTGQTLGQQRQILFDKVLEQLELVVKSDVLIRVYARFNPVGDYPILSCNTLGGAGATTMWANFANAPLPDTYYCSALADAIAGSELGSYYDIQATFNSDYDTGVCPGNGWYYGLDGNPGVGQQHLYPTLLHEVIHGLGFQSFVNESTGANPNGPAGQMNDIWNYFLFDETAGQYWYEMDAAGRQASAVNNLNLSWHGAESTAAAHGSLFGQGMEVVVNTPPDIAGTYAATGALFGQAPTPVDFTGDLELVNDGTGGVGDPTDACEPLIGFTAGNIAYIVRGTCEFGLKALNAQNAGASAVIIANNTDGDDIINMAPGAVGDQVTVPTVAISQNSGAIIQPWLTTTGVNSTQHVLHRWGTHELSNYPLMYAPTTVDPGSSISHWDVNFEPSSIMEPFANPEDYKDIDLTPALFRDVGWETFPDGWMFGDGFETGDTSAWSSVFP